jgi:predicted DNA-binding transcriptional regulator AlpA
MLTLVGKEKPRTTDDALPTGKILSRAERRTLTGLSESTLNRLEKAHQFPARVRLTVSRVGWPESLVLAWIKNRKTVVPGTTPVA